MSSPAIFWTCTYSVQVMCMQCTNSVQVMCMQCTNSVQVMCMQCTNSVQVVYMQCINSVQSSMHVARVYFANSSLLFYYSYAHPSHNHRNVATRCALQFQRGRVLINPSPTSSELNQLIIWNTVTEYCKIQLVCPHSEPKSGHLS